MRLTTSPAHAEPAAHLGRSLAAVVAIPLGAVSVAARFADHASNSSPADLGAGLVGVAGGLITGLLVRRLVLRVWRGVRAARSWVERISRPALTTVPEVFGWVPVLSSVVVVPVVVESSIGRRGPPRGSNR